MQIGDIYTGVVAIARRLMHEIEAAATAVYFTGNSKGGAEAALAALSAAAVTAAPIRREHPANNLPDFCPIFGGWYGPKRPNRATADRWQFQ